MLGNQRNEEKESGKALALTLALTNLLLLSVVGGIFWLVYLILSGNSALNQITRGFNLY